MGMHQVLGMNPAQAVTPSPHHELLVRAALLSGAPMVAAWAEWRRTVNFDDDLLDGATMRLLPLVYHNLSKQGIHDEILGRLRGIHRRTWVNNQLQFAACARLLRIFHAAAIPTLVLKGAALVTQFYPDHGARPMGDVDVLVPKAQAQTALDLLTEHGWRPTDMPRARMTPAFTSVRHAQNFAGPDGADLDLHWHVFINHLDEATDRLLWDGAIPHRVQQVTTRSLNPTDQLLHVCAHGMALAPVARVGWIPDAMMILRRAGDQLDWSRLLEITARSGNSFPLLAALTYLREQLAAPVPDDVLHACAALPVSPQEAALFRAFARREHPWGQLPILWHRYRLARAQSHQVRAPWWGFPAYLRLYHGKGSLGEMVSWAVARARLRAGNFLRARWDLWRAGQRSTS